MQDSTPIKEFDKNENSNQKLLTNFTLSDKKEPLKLNLSILPHHSPGITQSRDGSFRLIPKPLDES